MIDMLLENTFTYKYDARGNLLFEKEDGEITRRTYDREGRLVRERWIRPGFHREASSEEGLLERTWRYDREGRLIASTDFTERCAYHYDAPQRRTWTRQVCTDGGVVRETRLVYEGYRLKSRRASSRPVGSDEVVRWTDESRGYDAAGRPVSVVLREGRGAGGQIYEVRSSFVYDEAGRLIEERVGEALERWSYDAAGNLRSSMHYRPADEEAYIGEESKEVYHLYDCYTPSGELRPGIGATPSPGARPSLPAYSKKLVIQDIP